MSTTTNEILRHIADTLGLEFRKVSEIIRADYRGGIVHPLREGVDRIVEADFTFPGRLISWVTGVGPRPFAGENLNRIAKLRTFAEWQAGTANRMTARLGSLDREPTAEDWKSEYWRLVEERAEYNVRGPSPASADLPQSATITDDDPNWDWFGNDVCRHNAEWDDKNKRWVGGQPSLHSLIYDKTAERILKRFRTDGTAGDELQNIVHLSDGTKVNGNRLVKGERAKQAAVYLKEWNAHRGFDVSKWAIPTDKEAMTVTGSEADRQRILQDAFQQLAEPGEFTPEKWAEVAYKLYQAPQTKTGSDAVIRTFLAGVAAHRMGWVPAFPHDIDLRAYTMRQQDFVNCVVDGTFDRLLLPAGLGVQTRPAAP
ncbi:hypothetical protein [Nocardia wallacei]|uniref:hypothetical protein n=1 Tax=Nocardia wallacei TaxID=480035 RepID=UPI002456F30D|nr:hypothetical protein [Nocardia wallacei]